MINIADITSTFAKYETYVLITFLFAFLFSAFKIGLDDLKTRYVGIVDFFVFQILSSVMAFLVFKSVLASVLLFSVFAIHFTLQIVSEKIKSVGDYLGDDWKVGSIAIFDYFLYAIAGIFAMTGVLVNGMFAFAFMWMATFLAFGTGYAFQKKYGSFYSEDEDGMPKLSIPLFMYLNFFLAFFILSNTILRFF